VHYFKGFRGCRSPDFLRPTCYGRIWPRTVSAFVVPATQETTTFQSSDGVSGVTQWKGPTVGPSDQIARLRFIRLWLASIADHERRSVPDKEI